MSTVLFHGAGTWTGVDDTHLHKLDATLHQMACQMLTPTVSLPEAWHLGLSQVLAKVGLPRASTYLHLARLRHLLACVQLNIPEIWALAHWECNWLASVRGSVQWLWEQVDGGRDTADWHKAWEAWHEECQQYPGRWKARMRRALKAALHRERWQACVEQHAGLLTKQLTMQGAVLPADLVPDHGTTEVCAICRSVFKNFQAWSVHAFKRHGRVREARSLAAGNQCPGCLRHYASNIRLCRHLHHSAHCRKFLTGQQDRVHPQPGQGSKQTPKEHLLCTPTLQALGPLQACTDEEVESELERPSAEVLECLSLLGYPENRLLILINKV